MDSNPNPFNYVNVSPSFTKLRSPMEKLKLCKGYTPPWKDTFRKRCSERAKDNRSKLMDRFRGSPIGKSKCNENLIRQEFQNFQKELGDSLPISDLDVDHVLQFFNEIQHQLIKEEQEELEEMLAKDEIMEAEMCSEYLQNQAPICPNCLNIILTVDSKSSSILCHNCNLNGTIPRECIENTDKIMDSLQNIMQIHPCPELKFHAHPQQNNRLISLCPKCKFEAFVFKS